ncbi:hypothetical protein [Salidesulfovibrio onnuriiensis]|uniref:hypothetical protein n=1 Tax=Salidesulfovibrio onnuriiensis TaxID=2583823 RepID=UPI0011CCDB68|nr:hypothetical protein [Salidesulfovibrio onnuriiensis]
MRIADLIVCIAAGVLIVLPVLFPELLPGFKAWTTACPFLSGFVKFALLATFGESLALRIATGAYLRPGFGVLPRALAWGVLGMSVSLAFTIFAAGAPALLARMGFAHPQPVLVAFTVSLTMNCIYAPVLMLAHKLSDAHVERTGGSLPAYLTTMPDIAAYFAAIDWSIMWGFVFRKTIPLFWVPAHVVTFLLPPYLRVGFAALLSVTLGVILALAAHKARSR